MSEFNTDLKDSRATRLARLAVLQRMKDQAVDCDRAGMFVSLERLMQVESHALSKASENDSRPSSD